MALVTYRSSSDPAEAIAILPMIENIEVCYPNFRRWYLDKAVPDLASGKGRMILAEQDGQVVGVALGKRDEDERKLRCLRVEQRLRSRGIGSHLIDRILKELGTDRPLCTVSEEMMHDLSRLMVNGFGFHLTSVEKGAYRPGKLEYVFNGIAPLPRRAKQ